VTAQSQYRASSTKLGGQRRLAERRDALRLALEASADRPVRRRIAAYLSSASPGPILASKPWLEAARSRPRCGFEAERVLALRYGENPHQEAGILPQSTRPRSAWPA